MFNCIKYRSVFIIFIYIVSNNFIFTDYKFWSQPLAYGEPDKVSYQVSNNQRELKTLEDFNNAFIEIAATANPSVVTVFCEKVVKNRNGYREFPFLPNPFQNPRDFGRQPEQEEYRQQGFGSGVIFSKDGYIITNNHVIKDADKIYVGGIESNKTFPAELIGTDPKADIAIIKVQKDNLPVIKLGNSDNLKVGEWIMAIGSPIAANLAHTVTCGIISGKGRTGVGLAEYEDFIQTDAAINPGNSGGALINLNGELVGINTAIATQTGGFQGVSFAIPINMARQIAEMLITKGSVSRGWLGVYVQDIKDDVAKAIGLPVTYGALINEISKDSPAEKSGLKEGDVIIELNGKMIKDMSTLHNSIASLLPGTKVTVKLFRNNIEKSVTVELGTLTPDSVARITVDEFEDMLGIHVAEFSDILASKYKLHKLLKGVVIVNIKSESPAFIAGLREGDLIVSINQKNLESLKEFKQNAQKLKRGDLVLLNVIRKDKHSFIVFKL